MSDKLNDMSGGTSFELLRTYFTTCHPDLPYSNNCVLDRAIGIGDFFVQNPFYVGAIAGVTGVLMHVFNSNRKLARMEAKLDDISAKLEAKKPSLDI